MTKTTVLENGMIREELHPQVYYYRNAIPNVKEWLELVNDSENNPDIYPVLTPWNQWDVDENRSMGHPYVYGYKKLCLLNNVYNIDKDVSEETKEMFAKIRDPLFNAIRSVCEDYKKEQDIKEELILLEQFGVHRYRSGKFMGVHHDSQEGDTRLLYSLVVWPNDDYEGGELSFSIKNGVLTGTENSLYGDIDDPRNEGQYDFYIKPEAGSIVIFPSPSPFSHTAHDVKSGWKYMLPMFWIDPSGEDVLFKQDPDWEPEFVYPDKEDLFK